MRGGVRTLVALALVGAPAFVAPAPVGAGDGPAVDLLERAEEAARSESLAGVVAVEWYDGRRSRRAEVPVHSAGGVLRVGDDVAGSGPQRLVKGPKGWLSLWGHDVVALGPSPAAKYALTVAPGPPVAGRTTQMVEVRVEVEEAPRERLYLDDATGLVLRRELLDARGRSYRSVAFTQIRATTARASAPERSAAREPSPAGDIDHPYEAPERLGAGYRLVGAYEKPGHLIHLFYSDGLHGLSVFEQRGRLTRRAMPAGGERVELDGHTVRAYSTAVGEAMVWEGDGVVYTVVSDAPRADVAAAVGDLPHAGPPMRLRRVAEAVVSLFRWR